jgi:hypothetical protein
MTLKKSGLCSGKTCGIPNLLNDGNPSSWFLTDRTCCENNTLLRPSIPTMMRASSRFVFLQQLVGKLIRPRFDLSNGEKHWEKNAKGKLWRLFSEREPILNDLPYAAHFEYFSEDQFLPRKWQELISAEFHPRYRLHSCIMR